MQSLKKAESLLVRLETAVLVLLVAVMVALSFWQVLLRQFFGTGLLWADTLTRHLVLWLGFLGAALAAAENKHFAFEALHQEGRAGAALRLFGNVFGAAVCVLLVSASWQYFQGERDAAQTLFSVGSINVPSTWFAAAIPVGFALLLVHLLIRAALSAGDLK